MSSVPPVNVQVSTDPANIGTLIEGTFIDVVCNSTISNGVNTDYTVSVQWTKNGAMIANGTDYSISPVTEVSVNNYISTLRIKELTTGDDSFMCSVTVTPSVSTFITGNNGNNDIIIRVRGLYIISIRMVKVIYSH